MKIPYYLDKYKFCPLCASKLNHKRNFIECSSCGYRIFDNSKPAMSAIIENNLSEVLVVKRKIDPFKGWFDLPGGFIQSGESLEKATKREIGEEIGANISIKSYIGNYTTNYVYQGLFYKLIVFVVSGQLLNNDLKAGDDASEIVFIDKNKLLLNTSMSFPEVNIEALKDYMKFTQKD